MSSSTKQAQLRSLMKQQQQTASAASSAAQKVESPFAKYTANGDLVCILCKVPVKSSSAWNAHCATPTHKQLLETLIQKKRQQKSAEITPQTRDTDEQEPSAKRAKFVEADEDQRHHADSSMPQLPPQHDVQLPEAPSEPTLSDAEILRELRDEWEQQEAMILNFDKNVVSEATEDDDNGNVGGSNQYDDGLGEDSEEEEDYQEGYENQEEQNLASAVWRARLLREQKDAPIFGKDEEEEEEHVNEEQSSSEESDSDEEVDINSLYDWRARKGKELEKSLLEL